MKKVLIILAVALTAVTASAQIVSSNSKNETSELRVYPAGWNSITLEYNNWGMNLPGGFLLKGLSKSLNGVSIGYKKAFNVVQQIPLYVEGGFDAQIALYSGAYDIGYVEKYNGTALSARLPVSLIYHWTLPNNSKISIEPLVGLNLKVLAFGEIKEEITYSSGNKEIKYRDIFNKEDIGFLLGNAANRVLFGAHYGVNVLINEKYSLGIKYDTDFTNIANGNTTKLHVFSLALGSRF